MRKEKIKSVIFIFIVLLLFPISFLYRRYRSNDIEANSKFIIGKIVKFTTSLKSGNSWYYEFNYNGSQYEGSKPTHIDYDVSIGDCFLVNFSSEDPEHNEIMYNYKLDNNKLNLIDSVWDTIPQSILHSAFKK